MKADIMAREANRTVTPAEVRDALERPITAEERSSSRRS